MPFAKPVSSVFALLLGLTIATPLVATDPADAPKKASTAKKPATPTKKPATPGKSAATTKKPAAKGATTPRGDVTRAQLQTEVKRTFTLADTNHDGFMSRQEFAVRMGAVINSHPAAGKLAKDQVQSMLDAANQAFNNVDADHDGKLSLGEASKRPLAAFDMMDANHDGVLTLAEKAAAHRVAEGGPGGPGGPTPGELQGPGR